jgi:hypothetical protein
MERPCKACKAPLIFVRDMEGRTQVLDKAAPVYILRDDIDGNSVAIRAANSYASHYSTCPRASEFSRKEKP